MMRRSLLAFCLAASVVACGREPAPATAPSTPASSAGAQAPPATSTPTATPDTAPPDTQARASQESSGDQAAAESGDQALQRLAQLPPQQQLPGGRWKAGQHYRPLVPAQPTGVPAGKVEVVEAFWYGCNHCYALEPFLQSWQKNKPANIELVKLPVTWQPVHKSHARLFYTLKALGREQDLTPKVFDEIHQRGNLLFADNEAKTRALQVAFAKANGIAEADFRKAYDSFSVSSNLQRAEILENRYQVTGVPLIVVAGKYVTDVGMAGGQKELLALINDLAASEQRR